MGYSYLEDNISNIQVLYVEVINNIMCCEIFRVINEDGNSDVPQNLKLNDEVLISDVKRNENLKLKSMSGETFTFSKVLNSIFDKVLLIKTEQRTWIFEQI